jgi:prepilin-type processing-associated H-X9-DG protein
VFQPRGTSLIGLMVSLVLLLVLGVIMSSAINKGMTGGGSTLSGTVASGEDRMYLAALYQSMAVQAQLGEGRFLVPSALTRSRDRRDDTTANLFSAMIAQNYVAPDQLYSANEFNPYVWPDEDYDYLAYNPAEDVHWDPGFVADLALDSNVSFAHLPLYGRRFTKYWRFTVDSTVPLVGNRGPKNGIHDASSYTYGRNGKWAGHIVFGDGHVEFVETFTPKGIFWEDHGQPLPDNLFRMESGPEGIDVVLAFTEAMTEEGPVLQYD